MIRLTTLAVALALLSGCADRGSFPSLAKRPFETGGSATPPPAPPAAAAETPSDPARLARVAASLDQARGSTAAFNTQLGKSRAQVNAASGAATASEAWIEGQMAASRLEPLLSPASTAATAIAEEYRALMLLPPSPDRVPVEAALAEATAIADAQAQQVAELTAKLSR